jgi:GTP cyclohydrolase I
MSDAKAIEKATKEILKALGEDPQRDGLEDTPQRVARAYAELTAGYSEDIDKLINQALFDVEYNEMVLVKDINFYSLCEHHMLPFFGTAHVAYVPDKKVVGLSKIPRIVQVFSRRLQVQERLNRQIAETLLEKLQPLGVGVVLEARHMCMEMRGIKSCDSPTVTSTMLGSFQQDQRTRGEFLRLIRH